MGNCVFIIPVSETEIFSCYYKDFKILQCTQVTTGICIGYTMVWSGIHECNECTA